MSVRAQWPPLSDLTISPWSQDHRSPDPARRLLFYLGCHRPWWLEHSPVPLCVSARTLAGYAPGSPRMPRARCLYAIDSGAYTEMRNHGAWQWDHDRYGGMIYRFMDDCGPPAWVAPLDMPCEPSVLARSGRTVSDHQEWTLESYQYLTIQFPAAPWIPVLQGWSIKDYERHDRMYRRVGIDLAARPVVGLGSVCRRGSVGEIAAIAARFSQRYRLHGFGVKTAALRRCADSFVSADSMAWSRQARYEGIRLPGCAHRGYCTNPHLLSPKPPDAPNRVRKRSAPADGSSAPRASWTRRRPRPAERVRPAFTRLGRSAARDIRKEGSCP